jgi:hypothetical protein
MSGCVESNTKTVYYSKEYNETIKLYSDGTFIFIGDSSYSGTYMVEENHIILKFVAFGLVVDLIKEGNKLTDPKKGEIWVLTT